MCNLLLTSLPSPLGGRGWTAEGGTGEGKCPLADLPPPLNRPADLPALIAALQSLKVDPRDGDLYSIFFATPQKTKLEQFYQLLYFIQLQARPEQLPITVAPPGVTEVLIAARVFTDPSFPNRIRKVVLAKEGGDLRYTVHFDAEEVRFPMNQGRGFAVWEHGKCQWARELVFQNGFSFRLKKSGRNLVVFDFKKVEVFGDFGSRGLIHLDLNYAALERVEFIDGTDQGKVKTRVAEREFKTNPHSFLFRFVGRLIPDTSRERIDW